MGEIIHESHAGEVQEDRWIPPDRYPQYRPDGGIPINDRGRGRPPKWEVRLRAYLKELTDADYAPEYIYEIDRSVRIAFKDWKIYDPMQIQPDNIRSHLAHWPEGGTRIQHRRYLNGFLTYCGNYVIRGMRWRDPFDARVRVRWLDATQIEAILSCNLEPKEELIIRLGLDMGLRRVEMERTLMGDVLPGFLTVRGKGKKLRSVPFPPDFQPCMDRWLQTRDGLIASYSGEAPDNLILVKFRGRLTGIKRSTLNKIYIRVSEKVGFHFSFHDLRRTWARTAWEVGIPTETISLILGHNDTKTTLRYIGVHAEHAREAMRQIHLAKVQRAGGNKNGRKIEEPGTEPDTKV